jgi:hypothetical protein
MNARFSFPGRAKMVKVVLLAGLVAGGYVVGYATAAQPHMMNALNALQTARGELVMAESNKGGHRVIAIQRIDEAINPVRLGIAAAAGG